MNYILLKYHSVEFRSAALSLCQNDNLPDYNSALMSFCLNIILVIVNLLFAILSDRHSVILLNAICLNVILPYFHSA